MTGNTTANGVAPRVSVIMLTFNRPQFIGRAIESVVAQTVTDWELLVVQDGDNQQIVSLMRAWEQREPRIRYFHRDKSGNIANACNYALHRARGEFIAVLDDDDYWAGSDKLAKQIRFLEEHPDHVGCGGGVTVIDEHNTPQLTYFKPENDGDIKRVALFANPLAHSTTLYRKSAADRVGGYEESLAGFQDWDLWLKLGQIGKLYNFPEVLMFYTIWGGGGSFSQSKGNTRSAVRIVRRHWGQYRGSWAALGLAYAYFVYARTPKWIQQPTFSTLSRLKKWFFSPRNSGATQPAGK